MWFAEVKAKAKRKNQILFSKDSLLLTDLCQLIAQANHMVSCLPFPYNCTTLVAIRSQKVLSCSTKRIVGW